MSLPANFLAKNRRQRAADEKAIEREVKALRADSRVTLRDDCKTAAERAAFDTLGKIHRHNPPPAFYVWPPTRRST